MARPGRPERNRANRSFGQLRRFHHGINSNKVFGTHTAQVAEALASDKAQALQLREKLAKFVELGLVLDDCFADFKSAAVEMKAVVDDIHALGCATPDNQLFRVNCDLAFKTAVQGTPFWSHDFPAMSSTQRKTFGSLVKSWSAAIEANVAARLGEKKKDAA
jgi:hypothetical protein